MTTHERKTKEPQNQSQMDVFYQKGPVQMGPWSSHIYRNDPRHLCFLLSRYKFCAKMLAGKKKVLEIGCGDTFGLPIVKQTVESVLGIDFEPLIIEDVLARLDGENMEGVSVCVHDITDLPMPDHFDAAYSLDVIEHIDTSRERMFMRNMLLSLTPHAVCIIGTPNVTAKKYASEYSSMGHINLKGADDLHRLMAAYFHNVFDFSMNDEVVHTGYAPMAHYLLCMGVDPKIR